jgi:carbohydrate-selective porin OprB
LILCGCAPGARAEERAVTYGLSYVAEGFASRGAAQYLGSLFSSVSLNLERLNMGRGTVFASGQALHGRGINDYVVGAAQPLSNLDSPGFARVMEAWYAGAYLDGHLEVKAGRQYADGDFGVARNAALFLNSSFGAIPTTPLPAYPDPAPGAMIRVAPSQPVAFALGVYGAGFAIAEAQLAAGRIGLWRQAGNRGVYAAADRSFGRKGVFAQWGWAPRGPNAITMYAGGGFVYERAADAAGAAFACARLSAGKAETIYELFYRRSLGAKLALQPDLQWVRNAGGARASALAMGLRLALSL